MLVGLGHKVPIFDVEEVLGSTGYATPTDTGFSEKSKRLQKRWSGKLDGGPERVRGKGTDGRS